MSAESKTYLLATVAFIVDEYNVVINQGSENGVRIGSRYLVFGLGPVIDDPATGQSMGQLELVRGQGIIVHVQEKMATLRSSRTRAAPSVVRKIQRGDGRGLLSFATLPSTETIEETKGESITLPFDDVRINDSARPI